MPKKNLFLAMFSVFIFMALPLPIYASSSADPLSLIRESKAYQQFKKRPVSNLSKILYLIERFETSNFEVNYSGFYYKAPMAALIAKFFIAAHYKKETVPAWINLWCHRTVDGQLIYVRFPDGKFNRSSEILIKEWKTLEVIVAQETAAADRGGEAQKIFLGGTPKTSAVFS